MIKTRYKLCRFFVVPGGGPALLGMPDIKILGILSVICNRLELRGHTGGTGEHRIEDKSCTNKNLNAHSMVNNKDKYKIDNFCGNGMQI